MKLIRKIAFLAFAFAMIMGSSNSLNAQSKYGHLNYNNVLELMPEYKRGNTQLETYGNQLVEQGKSRLGKFQAEVQEYQRKEQAGELTGLQIKQAQERLAKEEQAILALEQQMSEKIAKKRTDILQPLLTRVDKAIEDVGRENGYTMIFNTSMFGFILSLEDSDDVMPLVKSKLGL